MPTGAPEKTHQSCRFYVEIEGVTEAVFTEVTGLSMEVATEDVEEGGRNDFVHRMPGRCKVGNLVLKRGMTKSNALLKWSIEVSQGTLKPRHISVIVYNVDGSESLRWDFLSAYPVKWTGPQFKADDVGTAIESMELAHEGFTLG
jgi:phage tail-like protein